MPGMAEPDIAIDIVSSASGKSEVRQNRTTVFAPRPRLAARALRLIGLDATITAGSAFLCFAMFHPARLFASSPVVLPMACLTVCLVLSFTERGLYAPAEIVSRRLPWPKFAWAWLQAVAIGTLITLCLAAISSALAPATSSGFDRMGAVLRGRGCRHSSSSASAHWLSPGCYGFDFHAGPEPLNRTVIIGEGEQIHDLLFRIQRERPSQFST